ncbi:MAG: hypothetical protein IJ763_06250 [Lachnospiraceae bacterium]|nr:hypothetical protein [Lachnospiraceae bacterium]
MGNSVFIAIKSKKYNVMIPLERRITFLRGDSGVGKSAFIEYVLLSDSDMDIELCKPDGFDVDVLTSTDLEFSIQVKCKRIIILDSLISSETIEFGEAVNEYLIKNDLYLLIMSRVEIPMSKDRDNDLYYRERNVLYLKKDEKDLTKRIVISE